MGVDRGLQLLSHKGWVLHLDADIVLPPHFQESLEDANLDENCIYGADRFSIKDSQWERFKNGPFLSQWSRCAGHNVCFPGGMTVGARWADTVQGWVPIGFFQLWYGPNTMRDGLRVKRYPTYGHSDAARTDVQFGLLWDRRQRILLPEVIVAHLESEDSHTGINWQGRVSKKFGCSNSSKHTTPPS